MLPGYSSGVYGMYENLIVSGIDIVGEGAADLAQHVRWRERARPSIGVVQQWRESFAPMGVGDRTSQRAPQPLDAVGLRVIGGRVDQDELTTQFLEQVS